MAIERNRLHYLWLSALLLSGCSSSPYTSTPATAAAVASVAPGRGIWFWESAAQQNIVATPSAQPQAIANLKAWNVTSVYGSYASQIASNPAAVRAWNANLAANGIASYSLVSSPTFFLPEQWRAAQSWLQTNFIGFNAASKPGEGFIGVAFDVEPASFSGTSTEVSWNATTPAGRRTYLTDFTDMLQSARAFLNANGAGTAPIQTYLVNWFSSLNQSISWASAADRNQWFASLASICDRITVEEYETSSTASIVSTYQTNDVLLSGKSRIALNSADTVWSTPSLFWQDLGLVESQTSTFVDIEDYDTTITQ